MILSLTLAFALPAPAQINYLTQPGTPTYSVTEALDAGIGFVNVSNGNLHIEIPFVFAPQRSKLGFGAAMRGAAA